MEYMFNGCTALTSLNLNNFNTLKKPVITDIFNNINSNLKICISNSTTIYQEYASIVDCNTICYENEYYYCYNKYCPENYNKSIIERKECITDCYIDNVYKYNFNNTCYKECPEGTKNNSFICEKYNIKEIFSNNLNNYTKEEIIENIKENLINENYEDIINEISNGNDLVIEDHEIRICITSTENQKNNKNNNITLINLGDCEKELKEYYNISNNNSLIIYKIDIKKENMTIPRIEYEVYYPINGSKLDILDLNICNNIKIDLSIPIDIDNVDIYNSSSEYYNDICYKSISNIDIILKDRQIESVNNDMNACEEICYFKEYNKKFKTALCSCEIKKNINSLININTTKLFENFKNIKNIINFNVMKCYKITFSKDGIIKNIGFYLISSNIILHFICIIIFYKIDFIKIKEQISYMNSIKNIKKGDEKKYKKRG